MPSFFTLDYDLIGVILQNNCAFGRAPVKSLVYIQDKLFFSQFHFLACYTVSLSDSFQPKICKPTFLLSCCMSTLSAIQWLHSILERTLRWAVCLSGCLKGDFTVFGEGGTLQGVGHPSSWQVEWKMLERNWASWHFFCSLSTLSITGSFSMEIQYINQLETLLCSTY